MDMVLSLLAFIAVVIGVLGEARNLKTMKWKAVTGWGRAAIIVGLLVCFATIYKSMGDAAEKKKLTSELSGVKQELSNAKDEILTTSKKEGTRIRPSDFQIRLLVDYRVQPQAELPRTVSVSGKIGEAFYRGEFVNTKAPRQIRAGGRGPGYYGYRYYAENLTFGELENYLYLESLNGETFTAEFDAGQFPLSHSEKYSLRLFIMDLYIQGRHFSGRSYNDGKIETVLDFEEFHRLARERK